MNIVLISANTEAINMIPLPLGVNCVAVAARNAGHTVRVLDLMGRNDNTELIADVIRQSNPDLIGISVRNVDNQHMSETRFLLEPVRDVIAQCRALTAAPIVVGGAGFSIFPQPVLRYLGADMGICGEGEIAFVALLDALQAGSGLANVPGLCLPETTTNSAAIRTSLDRLPLPDPSLWSVPPAAKGDIWIPFQTRRGCPMKCAYCSTPALEGVKIRTHSIKDVVEALSRHVATGYRHFYFVDNTFNFPPRYAKELCKALMAANLNVHWRCILYPGYVDDELAKCMADAGCVEASLGFESGSPTILKNLNKKYTLDQIRQSSDLLRTYGIRRMGFLLLGGPGETRDTVKESLEFADSLQLDMLKLTVGIRIYPGTELAAIALREGVVDVSDDLLTPRFYLARGSEEWLLPAIRSWMADRSYCTM